MEVEVRGLDHNGRGIAKVNGKTCFIENALPDEKVEINILKDKKNFMEADLKKIIKSNENRVLEQCKYFLSCGGCNIMHMNYDLQKSYKIEKIKNIFKRFCNLDIDIDEFIQSEKFFYRNKITLHVDNNKIGLYENKTNRIIGIDKCLICDNKINDIYNDLLKINLNNVYKIIIRSSKNIDETMVIVDANNNIDINIFKETLKDKITTLVLKNGDKYNTIFGNGYIHEKLGNYIFKISPDSFFQVNTLQAEKLYAKVKEYLKGSNKVLDLYCGTGTIGIFVSDICKKIIGIEINKYAVDDANENKRLNKIKNIDFACKDSEQFLKKNSYDFDAIIVDPPRSGLNKNMIEDLVKIKPEKIIYVSCDPITLSRDINSLMKFYDLKKISLVDMFPNTSHVECVCVLKLK